METKERGPPKAPAEILPIAQADQVPTVLRDFQGLEMNNPAAEVHFWIEVTFGTKKFAA